MKILLLTIGVLALSYSTAEAGGVHGYYRSSGTYVMPHYRSNRDSTVTDNYTYRGNTNPYTGSTGTNSYRHDRTSPYFDGTPYRSGRIGHATNGW